MKGDRLHGLDALRGIAALCVLTHHLGIAQTHPWPGFGKGYLAVDFFFMLSGYVMARTYEARIGVDLSKIGFLANRVRRLWPLMTLGALLGLAARLLNGAPEGLAIVAAANIGFIPVVGGPDAFPVNPPAWSIAYELLANAVHALGRRLNANGLLLVAAVAAVVWASMSSATGKLNLGGSGATFWLGIPRVFISYTLGIVLWRTWRDVPPVKLPGWVTLLSMPILMLAGVSIGGWAYDLAFILLGCPFLIAGGLSLAGGRWGDLAGRMSFPLYATHMPVIWLFRNAGLGWFAGMTAAVALAFVLAEAARTRARFLGARLMKSQRGSPLNHRSS